MIQLTVLISPDNSIQLLHLNVDHSCSVSVCDTEINRLCGPSGRHSLDPIVVSITPSKGGCQTCGTTMSKTHAPIFQFPWPLTHLPCPHFPSRGYKLNSFANTSFFNEWQTAAQVPTACYSTQSLTANHKLTKQIPPILSFVVRTRISL